MFPPKKIADFCNRPRGGGVRECESTNNLIMIRTSFFSLALLGLLFSNLTFAAAPQDDIACKVQQDQINTALIVEGILTQTYRACSKGSLANVEVFGEIDFNGGSVDFHVMDANGTPRAMKTFTAANYNGSSMVLDNLAIPTMKGEYFLLFIKAMNGATVVLPGTNDAQSFVGEVRLNGTLQNKNIKFEASLRGASATLSEAQSGRVVDNDGNSTSTGPTALARVASDLDLSVDGDCVTAQRQSTGVLNFIGETLIQTFRTCERGRVEQIKLAAPFVQPGQEFLYFLTTNTGKDICTGTFTSDQLENGELLLELDKGSVRKNQLVMLTIVCPEDARLTLLASDADDFGRLYVNGQASLFNIAMAAGLVAATASDVEGVDEDKAKIEVTAYPVPFSTNLNVQIKGHISQGSTLKLLDQQGMPVRTISLTGGTSNGPVGFGDLSDLKPGLYTVKLWNGRQVISKRILKG